MPNSAFINPDDIRLKFTQVLSELYQKEVPLYKKMRALVQEGNAEVLRKNPALKATLETESLDLERHGAIRLGTACELKTMRDVFAIMGMFAVGYYDLTPSGIPVHSTAFRPLEPASLQKCSFRIFTSLLRLELIKDKTLRDQAQHALEEREIFTPKALNHVAQAQKSGGVRLEDANSFIAEILETFRWHAHANVDAKLYQKLHDQHRLIADIVCFKGPHINHLTPRTLDIDRVQEMMIEQGIPAKAIVEGPPRRTCPILLRQTAFTAVDEEVFFLSLDGPQSKGSHTARFGEIEQRGLALTPKGRDLYERLLAEVHKQITPTPDGKNTKEYELALKKVFKAFPDTWEAIDQHGLGYFTRTSTGALKPIIYEDFLPVSAAGIFRSNLGTGASADFNAQSKQGDFERALGCPVHDPFEIYQKATEA